MKSNQKINIALLPLVLLGSELLAQSSPLALPNAPEASSPLVASAQPPSTAMPLPPADGTGTPTLLTRQQAEKIALANNPRIHISQLIARVQHQVVRERRADDGECRDRDLEEAGRSNRAGWREAAQREAVRNRRSVCRLRR